MFDDGDLFDNFPDMDLDGDSDLADALIYEDIVAEEEGLTTQSHSRSFDVSEDDEDEILLKYGIDREDYLTREDYLEAVHEAKYDWRNFAEDGAEFDLDPEDFETEEEYEEALDNAKESKNSGFNATVIARRNDALRDLRNAAHGDTWHIDVPRCRFILESGTVASRYLTVDGIYLYAQAVKDHFKLPFDIPDEYDSIHTHFEALLGYLAEDNPENAMIIWEWCLDTFMSHIAYAENHNDLIHAILLDLGNFVEEFPAHIVNYMVRKPAFIEKLILQCTDSLWAIDEFVLIAIKERQFHIARRIMECAFACPQSKISDKTGYIDSCIEEASNWEETETMEVFEKHVFPIVLRETDVRIKNKIPRWQKEMREYIEEVERECEQYEYSRVFAWRAKYRDADEDPTFYDNEEEYLKAVEERKYAWRKHCDSGLGVDPKDFETYEEYSAALSIEREKLRAAERERKVKERAADPVNFTVYKFCKVSVNGYEKPYYYYLTGDLDLKVGDRVTVPFGASNTQINATVMSVGACYGCALPCHISKMKRVIALPDLGDV